MPSSTGPKCPNHAVPLLKSGEVGIGICPISDARFAYDADEAEKTKKLKINAMGQAVYQSDWKVKNIDGKDPS